MICVVFGISYKNEGATHKQLRTGSRSFWQIRHQHRSPQRSFTHRCTYAPAPGWQATEASECEAGAMPEQPRTGSSPWGAARGTTAWCVGTSKRRTTERLELP